MSPFKGSSPMLDRRKELGLTQQEVADKIGISQQSYQELESGDREPMITTVIKLCKALDAPFEELFTPEVIAAYPPRGMGRLAKKGKGRKR